MFEDLCQLCAECGTLSAASQLSGGINWREIAVGLLVISGTAIAAYRRWRAGRYNNSPHLVARDQLFGFVKGALANPRAWHSVGTDKVAFNIDIATGATNNSTTGANGIGLIGQVGVPQPPKPQFQTIQVGYGSSYTVTMPGGQDVSSVFTSNQLKNICKNAKRIGQELDNIAKGQQILSYLPARKN